MGVQSIEREAFKDLICNSENTLKEIADKEYLEKYYEVKKCCPEYSDRELKYHFIVLKYIDSKDTSVVDYINKKLSGELEPEYKRRKLLQNLERLEFNWTCDDNYDDDDANCCDWRSIEW